MCAMHDMDLAPLSAAWLYIPEIAKAMLLVVPGWRALNGRGWRLLVRYSIVAAVGVCLINW